MKNYFGLLIIGLLLGSCTKDKQLSCEVSYIPLDYSVEGNSLIPVNTQNFWLYADSIFNPAAGTVEKTQSTLINIEAVFEVNDITYFEFSELFPPMTMAGDTLLTVTTKSDGNCYNLKTMLFPVTDTTRVGDMQMLYPDSKEIVTPAGKFSGNIIYADHDIQKMYFHPGLGLIRLELRSAEGKMRRSLSLKEYKVK